MLADAASVTVWLLPATGLEIVADAVPEAGPVIGPGVLFVIVLRPPDQANVAV